MAPSTVEVDLRLEPDSDALVRRLSELKEELDLNIELASPPDFVPELPGWRERSPAVFREGRVTVRHFDLYGGPAPSLDHRGGAPGQVEGRLLARGAPELACQCPDAGRVNGSAHAPPRGRG